MHEVEAIRGPSDVVDNWVVQQAFEWGGLKSEDDD
jgi:hypothetical protein